MHPFYAEKLPRITEIITAALSRCERPDLSELDPREMFNTLLNLWERDSKPDLDRWYSDLQARVRSLSEERVTLETLSPGQTGYGGVKGPCIYAKLVRADRPDIILNIGPYDPPVHMRG